MLNRVIVDAAEAIVGITAVVGIRGLFARAAVQIARRGAKPKIEAFVQENTYTGPLSDEHKAGAAQLLDIVHSSRETRAAAMAEMQDLKVPPADVPLLLPKLKFKLMKVQSGFKKAVERTYKLKVQKLFKKELKHRLAEEYGFAKHEPMPLPKLDQKIVDFIDDLGAFDTVQKGISSVLSHFDPDDIQGAVDFASDVADVLAIPGLYSGGKALAREFKLLANDRTSLGDSLAKGVVPSLIRSGITGAGMAIDTAFGWMTLGAFTIGARWLGNKIAKQPLVDEINEQTELLQQRVQAIRARQQQVLSTINDTANDHLKGFAVKIDACPKVDSQPALINAMEQLRDGYRTGLADAVDQVGANTQAAIKQLPPKNWVDHVLFIDRRAEVAALYHDAKRGIEVRSVDVMHRFSIAAEADTENAISFVLSQQSFRNAQSLSALEALPKAANDTASGYARSLTRWENVCAAFWEEGMNRIAAVTSREHRALKDFAAIQEAEMAPLREKINVARVRLGKKEKNL